MIHVIRPAHSDQIQFIAGLPLFKISKIFKHRKHRLHQSYQMKLTKNIKHAIFPLHGLQLIPISLQILPPAPLTAAPSDRSTVKFVNSKLLQLQNLGSLFLTATPLTSPLTDSSTVPLSTGISLPWQLLYWLNLLTALLTVILFLWRRLFHCLLPWPTSTSVTLVLLSRRLFHHLLSFKQLPLNAFCKMSCLLTTLAPPTAVACHTCPAY